MIGGIPSQFSVANPLCGPLTLTIDVDENSYPVKFKNDEFEVYTSDLAVRGTEHNITI